MAVLILQMLSPIAGMSKYLHALLEMSYFYDLEKLGTPSKPDGILQDTWKLLKLHKTGIIPGKPERIRILFISDKKTCFRLTPSRKKNAKSYIRQGVCTVL